MATDTDVKIPIPFSVSDVFDYLIPGATFLVAAALFDYRLITKSDGALRDIHAPIFEVFSTVAIPVLERHDTVLSLFFVSAVAIASYVAGHIASSFSSLFIDRVLIFKGHGYPYRFLLNLHRKTFDRQGPHTYHGAFYRGFFFWANLALLSICAWAALGGSWWRGNALCWSVFAAGSAVMKFAISNSGWRRPGSWSYRLRHYLITQRRATKGHVRRGSRLKALAMTVAQWLLNTVTMNSIWALYAKPYDGLANLYTTYTNSRGPLERPIRESYATYFEEQFGCKPFALGSSTYWLTSCFIIQRAPEFAKMASNWLRLYEFARNLSTALYLAFLYCLVSLCVHREIVRELGDAMLDLAPVMLFSLAFMMLGRYYYLYVCYLSKFVFRAFVYLNVVKEPDWRLKNVGREVESL